MKTIQLVLYQFQELADAAKESAVRDNADCNVNENWWDNLYEDARNIGLKITAFDLDRAHYCNAEFVYDAGYTAAQIIAEHGQQTGTYGAAEDFKEGCDRITTGLAKDGSRYVQPDGLEAAQDACADSFLKALCHQYLRLLDHEYEYLTSDEAIATALIGNEYWFTADGKIATRLEKLGLTV